MKKAKPDLYGVMAEFTDAERLLEAAHRTYAQGYRRMDAYSPVPVEGLAEAIGFHRNRLPLIVLLGGLLGGVGAFFMQWYSSVIDYPLNIGGRPLNSWPAFIPITFEVTILVAALSAVFGMLGLNGLPKPYHPVFNVPSFEMASRSHFFLVVHGDDPNFDRAEVRAVPGRPRAEGRVRGRVLRGRSMRVESSTSTSTDGAVAEAGPRLAGSGGRRGCSCWRAAGARCTTSRGRTPTTPAPSSRTGQSARPLVAGTVARGELRADRHRFAGKTKDLKPVDTFPFPVDGPVLDRGQERYMIFCSPCHGAVGDGQGMIVQRGFSPPPSFHTDRLRKEPVGHYFHVITNGYGAMYPYASRIPPDDRWAIIAYVRALQLSQNAKLDDLPPDVRRPFAGAGPMSTTQALPAGLDRVRWWALIAGVIGLALCGLGAMTSPLQFYRSYLVAYVFWIGIALGSAAIVMLHHLVGGLWGFAIRRPLESAAMTLPLMALLFLPIALGVHELYPWAHPGGRAPPADPAQAGLPQRPVLPRQGGGLLRRLDRHRLAPAPLVGGARPLGRPAPRPEAPDAQRTGDDRALPDRDLRHGRLAHVARARLVLDDLRPHADDRAGADGLRLHDDRGHASRRGRARAPISTRRRSGTTSGTCCWPS